MLVKSSDYMRWLNPGVGYSIKKMFLVSDKEPKVNSMKICLIFLTLLFSLTAHARGNWNPYNLDHATYVHLPDDQKRVIAVKTMEFMVELESKYQHEYQTQGFSEERLQKYVETLQKLQQFFISSAYAYTDPSLQVLAEKFGTLVSKLGQGGCLYAGYVSRMNKDGKTCRHPRDVEGNDALSKAIRAAYLKGNGKCGAKNQITCNPVIFGYSTASGTEPFCVKSKEPGAKQNDAHNSAFDCMKQALSGSDKDQRLQVIADGMTASPSAFKEVQKVVFDTCACGDSKLNKYYVGDYMRPHRTCFGLLNTIRSVKNSECQVLDKVDTEDFATQWNLYFGKTDNFDDLTPEFHGTFDANYKALMGNDALKAICARKDQSADEKPVCETECKISGAGTSDQGKALTCTITKIGYELTKAGTSTREWKDVKPLKESFVVDKEGVTEVAVEIENGSPIACPAKLPANEIGETPKKTCTLVAAPHPTDKNKTLLTPSFEGFGEEKPEVEWPKETPLSEDKTSAVYEIGAEEQAIEVKFKIPGQASQGENKDQVCKGTVPKKSNDDGPKKTYTITAKAQELKKDTDPKQNVIAVVTEDGAEITELGTMQIKWTRKGYKGPKPKKEEKSAMVEDIKEEEKETKEEDKKDKKEDKEHSEDEDKDKESESSTTQTGQDFEINEPRVKEEYQSCATLLDEAGNELAPESCDKIIPIDKKKPAAQNQNNGPVAPPPVFMNPALNTRALGIQ